MPGAGARLFHIISVSKQSVRILNDVEVWLADVLLHVGTQRLCIAICTVSKRHNDVEIIRDALLSLH